MHYILKLHCPDRPGILATVANALVAQGGDIRDATAHYVTDDLDEGPIIEQDVRRVSHSTSVEEMTAIGRETESSVLARAVRWHLEHRILLNGTKTVVFAP